MALLVHVRLSHWSNYYCTVCSTVGHAGAYQPRAAGSPNGSLQTNLNGEWFAAGLLGLTTVSRRYERAARATGPAASK